MDVTTPVIDHGARMDIFEAIRLRRSIKPERMKTDPVDRGLIEQLLEAANWAPSHGQTEPWRFVVMSGDARLELAEAVCRDLADPGQSTLPDGDPRREKLMEKFRTPPYVIAIVVAPSTNPKIFEHEELASTAMAVQNMHLAARALGLAGFWSSGKKTFGPEVAQHLELEAPARCLGFFFVGWPGVPWPEGTRRPAGDKVTWR